MIARELISIVCVRVLNGSMQDVVIAMRMNEYKARTSSLLKTSMWRIAPRLLLLGVRHGARSGAVGSSRPRAMQNPASIIGR